MLSWDQGIKLAMLLGVLSAYLLMQLRLGSLAKAGRIPRSTLGMFKTHNNADQWAFLLSGKHKSLGDPLTTGLALPSTCADLGGLAVDDRRNSTVTGKAPGPGRPLPTTCKSNITEAEI
ncbi:hypothetical protein [Phenylobacterium aquaticum]|uniref:hypothetical protein n=1 Tax=Phenylobacterium aquaticum TaxID=1763816 RepID=UPI0026ED2BE9|nr:hypothetical protein [Phenylobacterium aquaticum]